MLELISSHQITSRDADTDYLPETAASERTALVLRVSGLPATWEIAGYCYQQINLTPDSLYDTWVIVEQFVLQAGRDTLVAPRDTRYPWRLLFRWQSYIKPCTLELYATDYEFIVAGETTAPEPEPPQPIILWADEYTAKNDGWQKTTRSEFPRGMAQGWDVLHYLDWNFPDTAGTYDVTARVGPALPQNITDTWRLRVNGITIENGNWLVESFAEWEGYPVRTMPIKSGVYIPSNGIIRFGVRRPGGGNSPIIDQLIFTPV